MDSLLLSHWEAWSGPWVVIMQLIDVLLNSTVSISYFYTANVSSRWKKEPPLGTYAWAGLADRLHPCPDIAAYRRLGGHLFRMGRGLPHSPETAVAVAEGV